MVRGDVWGRAVRDRRNELRKEGAEGLNERTNRRPKHSAATVAFAYGDSHGW